VTQPEGQTARDIFPEDEGLPEVSQDDSPTIAENEDPEFAPLPGERPGASADYGTTAREQAEDEPLDARLAREVPDVAPDVRPAAGLAPQLEQDAGTDPGSDSGTERIADDIEATADEPTGGESPEERAIHLTDG